MAPPRSAIAAKLAQAQENSDLLPSDSDDEDFRLSAGEEDDGGSDSSDSERETGTASKRAKVEEKPVENALNKESVDDLWASFNDPNALDPYASTSTSSTSNSVSQPQPTASTSTSSVPAPAATTTTTTVSETKKGKSRANLDQSDLVTIKVTYKFAGDTITQDKKVPRNSQEAKNYFALHPESSTSTSSATNPPAAQPSDTSSLDALFGPETTPSTSASTSTQKEESEPIPSVPPPSKPPTLSGGGAPKRKKAGGGGLGAMAASLGVGGKPAKLNTLEKSKLDWNSYVQTQEGLEDTLVHARKDGYLEKKDFLDRVEMRKEEGWEQGRKKGGR
ncbi:BCNT domain-containing protein [Sporobolomyces salmoneus]|uniref:BCNT domain-containing protein n=1 Tax=Sporobolomyces salmoneus TaxID=183962 RepID=UPI003175E117